MLSLPARFGVVLVFPVTDTQPAYEKPEVLAVLGALGSITLGASTAEGLGYWAPTNEFERAVHVYTCYDGIPATLERLEAAVFPVVVDWAVNTGQYAVAFEYGDRLEIFDTPELVVRA